MLLSYEDRIKELYNLGIWPEDPRTSKGYSRYRLAVRQFEKLLKHDWLVEFIRDKKSIRILEICAGAGVGGVALAKVLIDMGYEVDLVLTDIREKILEIGKIWGEEELGIEINVFKSDAAQVHKLGFEADIVLSYGFSTSHFDPWDMIKILASVSSTLRDNGIFMSHEIDTVYHLLYRIGYKEFRQENISDEKILISIHAGYDVERGSFKRAYLDLKKPAKHVVINYYYWSIASLAALSWLFFQDVDFAPIESNIQGFLIAKQPRRKINLSDIDYSPRIISKK